MVCHEDGLLLWSVRVYHKGGMRMVGHEGGLSIELSVVSGHL